MAEQDNFRLGSQTLLVVLGLAANLFLGALTIYASRLADDIKNIEAVARASAATAALLGRDFDNHSKWTVEEIRNNKARLERLEQRLR